MNRFLTFLAIGFSYLLGAQTSYYVSPGGNDFANGDVFNPFQTINHALSVSQPGTTVYLMGGTYSEVVFMPSGSPGNRITLTNYATQLPVLTSPLNNTDAIVNIIDASYVTIQGLEISGYYANDARGILIEGACSDISIINNRIQHISFTGNSSDPVLPTTNAQPLIVLGTDSLVPITNLLIQGNYILSSLTGYSEALAVNGNVDGFEISRNYIGDISNIGIDVIGGEGTCPLAANDNARNGIVKWNEVWSCVSAYATSAGIYCDGGNNLVIENNRVYECGWGIEIGCENQGTVSNNIIARNNLVYHNRDGGIVIGGYDYPSVSGKVTGSVVQHNTLVNNNSQGTNGELIINYTESCLVSGNIVYNSFHDELLYNDAGSLNLQCDYNCYYAVTPAVFSLNGNSYTGISAWQSISGTDQHSMETDPLLVSTVTLNLHLTQQSPCIDSGEVSFVPAPSESDIDTSARLQNGRVDIGADEYGTAVGVYVPVVAGDFTWVTDYENATLILTWTSPLRYEEEILLTDVQGKMISSTSMCIGEQGAAISIQGLAPGTYYAIIRGRSVAIPIVVVR